MEEIFLKVLATVANNQTLIMIFSNFLVLFLSVFGCRCCVRLYRETLPLSCPGPCGGVSAATFAVPPNGPAKKPTDGHRSAVHQQLSFSRAFE